ncbi:hypothetical protein LOAG_06804 [Loa loa]|uniref:Protein kinase domain-containing protein n=1 Tax=Loa loa TaxID=7209 RepID=A0A1I7VNE7_LOALO|nr:hypothetical protein LOAG_06804 [Loa loa]EFO21681.2 hypothetical protein LOAG_06804 [Loa loa]
MKRFLHLFLVGSLVVYFVYSFKIIEKKQHYRFRRCICLKIQPSLCQCNNEKELKQAAQQLYQGKSLAIASITERNAPISQKSAQLSACIPICLQTCVKKQYSRCQQSCQNMCKVEQSIPPFELSQAIPQQQQQLLQTQHEYFPPQHQTWESNMQEDSTAPVSEIQLSTAIPMSSVSKTSILVKESSKPLSLPFSDSTGQFDIPYGRFSDNNNNICTHACMPSCPCIQQSTSITAPVLQHQPPLESTVHQPSMSKGSFRQESAADNDKMPHLTQTLCASLCMPSCRDQCIHQTTILPSAFYSTPSPAFTYSLLTVQSQSSEQKYSAKAKKIPTNKAPKTRHFSVCLYICQDKCMQQCVQQNRSAKQCNISCNYACDDNCAQQRQQQQQLPELIQSQELPQPIHQQRQQISGIQYSPSFTRIQQVQQQIPINEIFPEQLLSQQQLGCSQQTSGILQCVPRIIIPANPEIHAKRKLE